MCTLVFIAINTPDSPWYEQTKPEVMFCTEEEAVQAGFRPPKR